MPNANELSENVIQQRKRATITQHFQSEKEKDHKYDKMIIRQILTAWKKNDTVSLTLLLFLYLCMLFNHLS